MRPFLVVMACLPAAACITGPANGTAVGNPTGMSMDTAPGVGLSFTSARAIVTRVTTVGIDGTVDEIPVEDTFDLLGDDRVAVPLARARTLRIAFGGPLQFTGTGPDGSSFLLDLEVDSLGVTMVSSTEDVPHAIFRLGAADWATSGALGLGSGATVTVAAGDPRHDSLVAALRAGTGLYRDLDGDGVCTADECDAAPLGEAEREDAAVDTGDGEDAEGATADSGVAEASGPEGAGADTGAASSEADAHGRGGHADAGKHMGGKSGNAAGREPGAEKGKGHGHTSREDDTGGS